MYACWPLEFKWSYIQAVWQQIRVARNFDKVKQFDLFGVSETHLLPNNGRQLDSFQDFHSYRKHGKRHNYGSRGISVYIKNKIVNGTSVIHGESSDCMWVCLKTHFFN